MSYKTRVAIIEDENGYRQWFEPWSANDSVNPNFNPLHRWKDKKGSYVYIIAADAVFSKDDANHGRIMFKVGMSDNPWSRCHELQTGCPHRLHIVETWKFPTRKIALAFEAEIHTELAAFRTHREWFVWRLEPAISRIHDRVIQDWVKAVRGNGFVVELLQYTGRTREKAHEILNDLYGEAC